MTRKAVFTYAAFCLLAASGWVVETFLPAPFPLTLELLVTNAFLSLLFLCFSRRIPAPRLLLHVAILFAVPPALIAAAGGALSSTAEVLVYTLVPAATVFFAAQSAEIDFLRLLAPAVAGVAGAALLLPFVFPSSTRSLAWLTVLVTSALAAGWSAVRLYALARREPIVSLATAICLTSTAAALPLLLQHLDFQPGPILFPAIAHLAFDAALVLLTATLVRELAPICFSSRFLLIPLVTVLEGYLILRPENTWTLAGGVVLLTAGVTMLMREGALTEIPENPHSPEIH